MKEKLLELLNNSYSPYSNFRVAAIALMKDGTEFNGVNVENASYGGAICAERSAIVSAISAGYKKHDFEKMYVMCDNEKIGMSCMICRQVIQEFFEKDKMIIAMNPNGDEIVHTVEELFKMKVGFVSIVGRPNAGKSTLINSIIGSKVAIVSDKAHTTRNNIQGIYNDDDSQIIFIDTPGIHKPMHKLGKYMNSQSYYSIEDTNVILFMVDATEKIGKGDKFILEKLKEVDSNVFLVLNKVDRIKKENLFPMIEEYNKLFDFKEIIPISALKKDNIDDLIKTIKKYLDEGERYYSEDYYTDKSINFMVSEIVREKVLNLTHEEVPHAVTCVLEKYEEEKNSIHINVLIIVEREGIKRILVGHSGSMIKEIGIEARKDIEELVGKKVYLELFVKTVNNWREKDKYLTEFGFNNE